MNIETKETLEKVAEYTYEEKRRMKKKMLEYTCATLILYVFNLLLEIANGFGFIKEAPRTNMQQFVAFAILAILALNVVYFSGLWEKFGVWKHR